MQYNGPAVLPWLWQPVELDGDVVLVPQPIPHIAGPSGEATLTLDGSHACACLNYHAPVMSNWLWNASVSTLSHYSVADCPDMRVDATQDNMCI